MKANRIDQILDRIEAEKLAIALALEGANLQLTLFVNDKLIDLGQSFKTASDGEVIGWLKRCDPAYACANHLSARRKHETGTGNWLLHSGPFTAWAAGEWRSLWLHGIPGAGKTVLCSSAIHPIQTLCLNRSDYDVTYFYFDFTDPQKQTVSSLLRSVIVQISGRRSPFPAVTRELYELCIKGSEQPTQEILATTFRSLLSTSDRLYLMIDGLDECSERQEILDFIAEVILYVSNNIYLFATTRHDQDIILVLQWRRRS